MSSLQNRRIRLPPINQDALFSDYFLCVICETASAMASMLAPEVRLQFAKRLKTMRTQRGFDRARYFARSLGIEENRYTRYERAEVEPSLTLIHKMCETLRVSPNELLGFGELRHQRPFEAVPGLAESSAEEIAHGQGGDTDGSGNRPDPSGSLAWSLASEAVAIRHEHGGRAKAAGDPFHMLQERAALFRSLQSDPFDTATQILEDRALKDVDPKRKAKLAELIQAYTDRISAAGAGRQRR
jgi:transcriptional regulator with XRE-family HTH domain